MVKISKILGTSPAFAAKLYSQWAGGGWIQELQKVLSILQDPKQLSTLGITMWFPSGPCDAFEARLHNLWIVACYIE
jgi:hypothetical protein